MEQRFDGVFYYRVYTTEFLYGEMLVQADAISYAKKISRRFPNAIVFVATMFCRSESPFLGDTKMFRGGKPYSNRPQP